MKEVEFFPIGTVRCKQKYRYEAARQPSISPDNQALIKLRNEPALRDGLKGLIGFEYIWVVYELHLNEGWNPFVQPPRSDIPKLGVFATRSPHRPNRIGLSCVRLLEINRGVIRIGRHDLLDGTPVLDLKPYLPYADAFPKAQAGWVDALDEKVYKLDVLPLAQTQMSWIEENAGWDLMNFLLVQLRSNPEDTIRKRIEKYSESKYSIAFRTWRIRYTVIVSKAQVEIDSVCSGYLLSELIENASDPHNDKKIHRLFNSLYL